MKWIGIALLVIVLLTVGAISLTIGWRPFIGPKARPLTGRKFEASPTRRARGQYLVESLGDCFGCHGEHDWKKHDAPLIAGTAGAGNWTDDQLARAIREGIGHDGRALFPFMPYPDLRIMSDEDLASVIVYIRSIPPVHKALPKTEIIFPVKYLIRNVPQPVTEPVPEPDRSNPTVYGKYLVSVAGCTDCHTPQSKGQNIPGMDFAGGFILEGPWGRVASTNITPDASGISYYDEALSIQTMRTGYVKARELNQIMPWWHFRNLTDDDLKAMFAYLRTLKPVKHQVDNTEPPTFCKLCRQTHGSGNQN